MLGLIETEGNAGFGDRDHVRHVLARVVELSADLAEGVPRLHRIIDRFQSRDNRTDAASVKSLERAAEKIVFLGTLGIITPAEAKERYRNSDGAPPSCIR